MCCVVERSHVAARTTSLSASSQEGLSEARIRITADVSIDGLDCIESQDLTPGLGLQQKACRRLTEWGITTTSSMTNEGGARLCMN